jgi:hypothetical protein
VIFPLINGVYYSYSNIELHIGSAAQLQIAGVKTINYKDNLGRVKVRGTAMQPLGLTQGRYEANGDIEMYLDAFMLLVTTLGPGWRQQPVQAVVTYGPGIPFPMPTIPFVTDVIPGFYLGELDASQSEGEEALTRKFTMHIPGQILWGGVPSLIEPLVLAAVA